MEEKTIPYQDFNHGAVKFWSSVKPGNYKLTDQEQNKRLQEINFILDNFIQETDGMENTGLSQKVK